jgi:Fis family transcriptional regulator, factor for inversion stimulation protein
MAIAELETAHPDTVARLTTPTHTRSPLHQAVREWIHQIFQTSGYSSLGNLYDLLLTEIEPPLLEVVLRHTGQNQSEAARLLAISRGTLRKKMHRYGMLDSTEKTES